MASRWMPFFVLTVSGLLFNMAAAEPIIVYPVGAGVAVAGEPLRVTTRLLQLELAQDLILSAEQGAEFSVEQIPLSDAVILRIVTGPAQLVDLSANTVALLPPGRYRLGSATLRVRKIDGDEGEVCRPDVAPPGLAYGDGYLLADYLMVNQGKYLTVPIASVNHLLSSVLRSLVGSKR